MNPEEALETAFHALKSTLSGELLQTVKDGSPAFFEQLVVDLLVKMGYGGSRKEAGMAIGKSGGEGIDGIIKEDRLGLDVIYIQAKRYTENTIGRPDIQKFAGALQGQRAKNQSDSSGALQSLLCQPNHVWFARPRTSSSKSGRHPSRM